MNTVIQTNPATGEVIGELAELTPDEITGAMAQARAAFPGWRDTPLAERLGSIRRLRLHLVEHAEELAREIASYTGKVMIEALSHEVFLTIDMLHYYEKNAAKYLKPQRAKTPLILFGNTSYIEYKPMGVVAVIAPWNFPFLLSMVPVISALIAGNAVLVKPSEVVPFMGRLFERVFAAAGFPADVFQVVHGGRDAGRLLVDARPDKIFFTGSVATGKKIMAAASEHLIPCELELGGKDPMIVFADSDLDRAARGAVWGAFTNAGQVCMSVERVYVEERAYDAFLQKVKALTAGLRMGQDFGSMTFPPQLNVVQAHLQDAVEKGAVIECGGHPLQEGTLYFAPTVLTGVDHSMKIMKDETFGPVLPIMTFRTEEEAVRLANDTEYGLNASIWTRDLAKAKRIASQLISASVCVNDAITSIANPDLPYGGVKNSGMGYYHAAAGLHAFSHQTSTMVNKGTKGREINWHPYSTDQETAFLALTRLLHGEKNRFGAGLNKLVSQFLRLYRKENVQERPAPAGQQKNMPFS